MTAALRLLYDFLAFAAPLLPGLAKVAREFFAAHPNIPPPPDMGKWERLDASIDRRLRAKRLPRPTPTR